MSSTLIDRTSDAAWAQTTAEPHPYALGYSESEFKRLEQQGALYRDLTEDIMRKAGLGPGMRVLDIGCGVGDVSLLAGELVGPSGLVLGVDRSAEAVETASARAARAGRDRWVRFAAAELDVFFTHERFDAIIGRLILMYLPDPSATLRRLTTRLRPGGIVAFQEMAVTLIHSVPAGPQFRRCTGWVSDALERGGFEIEMGGKLFATYVAAGLPAPQMIATARVEAGPASPVYDYMAATVRSLIPAIERLGVATADEIEIDTLAPRLRKEALDNSACIMLPPLVGAWTRMPV